jgi:hypothetical protein
MTETLIEYLQKAKFRLPQSQFDDLWDDHLDEICELIRKFYDARPCDIPSGTLNELRKAQKLEEGAFKNNDYHEGFKEGINTAIDLIEAAEPRSEIPSGTLNREALLTAKDAYEEAFPDATGVTFDGLKAGIAAYIAALPDRGEIPSGTLIGYFQRIVKLSFLTSLEPAHLGKQIIDMCDVAKQGIAAAQSVSQGEIRLIEADEKDITRLLLDMMKLATTKDLYAALAQRVLKDAGYSIVKRSTAYILFKAGETHCEDCPCRYGQHQREPKREAQPAGEILSMEDVEGLLIAYGHAKANNLPLESLQAMVDIVHELLDNTPKREMVAPPDLLHRLKNVLFNVNRGMSDHSALAGVQLYLQDLISEIEGGQS